MMSRTARPRGASWLARVLAATRRIIGVPDYEAYLASHGRTSAGTEPMSREAFTRHMLSRRYERAGNRCC